MTVTTAADVLDFWFGSPEAPGFGQPRNEWFRKDAGFDERIRSRFSGCVDAALAGQVDDWAATPEGLLGLLIVLDQFPRNLFRNQAKAFAGDERARRLAQQAVEQGWDQAFNLVQRVFLYLPFEHSESLADQERSIALFSALAEANPAAQGFLDYAHRHHEVIARFGRFPHRNAALGRLSTQEESDYLAQPGSGF